MALILWLACAGWLSLLSANAALPVLTLEPVPPISESSQADLIFHLSQTSAVPVTVEYTVSGVPGLESATFGEDFYFPSESNVSGLRNGGDRLGRLRFKPGETNVTLTVEGISDDYKEWNEAFKLHFTNAIGCTIDPALVTNLYTSYFTDYREGNLAYLEGPKTENGVVGYSLRSINTGADGSYVSSSLDLGGIARQVFLPGDWGTQPTLAVADVIPGDGQAEYIIGSGPGVRAHFAVFQRIPVPGADGYNLVKVYEEYPFTRPNGSDWTGGIWLAAGDFNWDGGADIVTTPRENDYPGSTQAPLGRVIIWDAWRSIRAEGGNTHWQIWNRAFETPSVPAEGGHLSFHVAVGDVTGEGYPDVILGAGRGNDPFVQVWTYTGDWANDASGFGRVYNAQMFDMSMNKGIFVGTCDLNSDGRSEVIIGTGSSFRERYWLPNATIYDSLEGQTSDGIQHVKIFDAVTWGVLYDRAWGDTISPLGTITMSDATEDTFVFGDRGFAGLMNARDFTLRGPNSTFPPWPADAYFIQRDFQGSFISRKEPQVWNQTTHPVVNVGPISGPAPSVRIAPTLNPITIKKYVLAPDSWLIESEAVRVPGHRIPADRILVIEESTDLKTWKELDVDQVRWWSNIKLEFAESRKDAHRFYRSKLVDLAQ